MITTNTKIKLVIPVVVIIILTLSLGCTFTAVGTKSADSPEFIDIESAKKGLESATWGSHGWTISQPNLSSYIYADFGSYMLGYNISENVIDRAIELKDIHTTFPGAGWSFSPDGNYAVVANVYDESFVYNPKDIYLIDFKKSKVKHLAKDGKDFKVESLPKHLRTGFDPEWFTWNVDYSNLHVLDYVMELEYDVTEGNTLYARDENDEKHEITHLEDSLLNNEIPCVGIDAGTIGSLIPLDGDGMYLGYYKFVLIDIAGDKIIQECPINEKTPTP